MTLSLSSGLIRRLQIDKLTDRPIRLGGNVIRGGGHVRERCPETGRYADLSSAEGKFWGLVGIRTRADPSFGPEVRHRELFSGTCRFSRLVRRRIRVGPLNNTAGSSP